MRKLLQRLLPVCLMVLLLCSCARAEELLALASAGEPLPEDYVPDSLRQISTANQGVHLVTSRSMLLQEEALEALYDLMRGASRSGITLYVRQAYRSYADEARRYELMTATGQAAQKPGESSYQTGLSVTLVGESWRTAELTEAFAASKEARWLSQHAAEYGFIQRYPEGKEDITGWTYEPWHYRYVGVSAAKTMAAQGLCLEELVGGGYTPEEAEPLAEDDGTDGTDTEDGADPQNGMAGSMSEDTGMEVNVAELLTAGDVAETEGLKVCVDVAKYQGTIDWQQVADAGIDFAMVRVGYRTQKTGEIAADSNARYNMQEAQAHGIKVGVYFFSTAVNVQ